MKSIKSETAISLLALVISGYTIMFDRQTYGDASRKEAISSAYDKWLEVSKLQVDQWMLAHLFAFPEQYNSVKNLVKSAEIGLSAEEKSELLLKERGMSIYIFTLFESTLYQWQQAVQNNDSRADFYKAVLDYQCGRQLRNPRLLYYWDQGLLSDYFEKSTKEYYAKHVLDGANLKFDAFGPFQEGQ